MPKNEIDVLPTAQIIDEMAETMRRAASRMNAISISMKAKKDISYAAEAINEAVNCFSNLRLDLMATRPIREPGKIKKETPTRE